MRCAVQLTDAELAVLLRATDLDASSAVRTSWFSLHERGARALLSAHGPDLSGDQPPHLMVMSMGRFGRSLLLALCQQWADLHPGTKLYPTVVDRAARGRWSWRYRAWGICDPSTARCARYWCEPAIAW